MHQAAFIGETCYISDSLQVSYRVINDSPMRKSVFHREKTKMAVIGY
jgi:hypothetical protein